MACKTKGQPIHVDRTCYACYKERQNNKWYKRIGKKVEKEVKISKRDRELIKQYNIKSSKQKKWNALPEDVKIELLRLWKFEVKIKNIVKEEK